jgi:hypothetical protein
LPLDIFLPAWHHAAAMIANEKQFSLTRAASMKRRRVKHQIPVSSLTTYGFPTYA